jgi:hypothetical protein
VQHDGRITTDTPDELWATDPTEPWTRLDGRCAVFAVVDHCSGEAWVDAAPRMDRLPSARSQRLRRALAARTPRLPLTPPSARRAHRSRARHGMIVADKPIRCPAIWRRRTDWPSTRNA